MVARGRSDVAFVPGTRGAGSMPFSGTVRATTWGQELKVHVAGQQSCNGRRQA